MELSSVHWVACGTCYTKTEGTAGSVQFSFIYWFHVMIVVMYQFKSFKYRRANHL